MCKLNIYVNEDLYYRKRNFKRKGNKNSNAAKLYAQAYILSLIEKLMIKLSKTLEKDF